MTSGQDLIEYALLTAAVGLAGLATWPLIETAVGTTLPGAGRPNTGLVATASPGRWAMTCFEAAAVAIATAACVTDLSSRRVPNALTFPAVVAGIAAHGLLPGGQGSLFAIGGAVVGLAVFLPILRARWHGRR